MTITPLYESPSSGHDGARAIPVQPAGTDADRPRRYDPFANSVAMRTLKRMITRAASTDATVLITGEKGVGKELAARALHHESPRLAHAFTKVDCAALPVDLLETELFGDEGGASTAAQCLRPGKFELATRGSILLDEIGEMPLPLQARLLHVLQGRESSRLNSRRRDVQVDVRVIATTSRDLAHLVDQGLFREDLYYRLSVIGLRVPPLRERREEIPVIAEFFVDRYARQYMRPRTAITPDTMRLFQAYPWPGNISELETTVKRIVALGSQDWLVHGLRGPDTAARPSPLPAAIADDVRVAASLADDAPSLTAIARAAALQAERGALSQVLEHVRWNRRAAARVLKVSYRTLRRKIEQCGLERREPPPPPPASSAVAASLPRRPNPPQR